MDATVIGQVVSVNVGQPRTIEWFGRQVRTAIWKAPVTGPVAVKGVNADGDDQADRRVHGGYDKAIYAYAQEDYEWWSDQLGLPLGPGTFGENLTTSGIDLAEAVVGEQWRVGSTVLEVSEPRSPCFKLGIRMGDADFKDQFDAAERFGTYLRIIEGGEVAAGAEIARLSRPAGPGRLTIGDMVQFDHRPTAEMLGRIAASEEVPERWRSLARRAILRHQADQAEDQAEAEADQAIQSP
jgi:MOSC domain-containing protein YiiM